MDVTTDKDMSRIDKLEKALQEAKDKLKLKQQKEIEKELSKVGFDLLQLKKVISQYENKLAFLDFLKKNKLKKLADFLDK